MKLHFYGADREVTGSRHLLEVNGKKILLDCGMFQGKRSEERDKNRDFGFDVKTVDAVIISHAHIDHSGNLPNLVKQGFNGPIYCTHPTTDLLDFMLMDSGFIQEREVEYINEKKKLAGEDLVEPIYTTEDVKKVLPLIKGINYEEEFKIFGTDDIVVKLHEAGHILGSAIIEIIVKDQDDGKTKRFAFTGDLGRKYMPLIKDPYQIKDVDYLMIESTYGNRFHDSLLQAEAKLAEVVKTTAARGGKILVPAFSLGRTQEIIYELHKLIDEKKIPELPIYVDSPLSVNLTNVFRQNLAELDDETNRTFLEGHEDPFRFPQLKYISDVEESKALNNHHGPCVIISSSGMCEHGRILHHIKNSIEDHRNTLVIVGFQAQNTLGRKLVDKMDPVNVFGKPYQVRFEIKIMNAYSAHADRNELLDYVHQANVQQKVILVHGEEQAALDLQKAMQQGGIKEVLVPSFGESVQL
jgi:metallo-beta-lactamase family protein